MPQADPITLLLANEQAEEIKLVTISMRGFYPGCRVEAVYSAAEALEWASKQDWDVILLDEQLSPRSGLDILPELRQRAPNTAVIVQTEQTDATTAVEAMRAGADYYLFKKSPAFLTELMIITREILEKRELRTRLDLTHERYLRLIETMTDMVYELDAEGRFVHVSPAFAGLLGYSTQELIGTHYSKFVHSDAARIAERRFNERRTGIRATRNLELRLVTRTGTLKQTNVLEIELAATGLYNRQRQFLGTVGVVRDINRHKQEQARIQRLEEQLRQTDRLMELGRSVVKVAHELSSPLTGILDDTERLLKKVQDLQLENQLEVVASQASRAAQIGKTLVAYTQPQQLVRLPVSISRVIEDVLSLASTDLRVHSIQVESHLAQTLPEILGNASQLQQVFLSLITQSGRVLQQSSQGGRLLVTARVAGAQEIPSLSASPPIPVRTSYVEVAIIPEGQEMADREDKSDSEPSFEWMATSRIIQEHGGVIEADIPSLGGTRIRVWLPAIETHQPSEAGAALDADRSQGQLTFPGTLPPHKPDTMTLLKKEQVLPHAERRRSSRIELQAETRLILQGTTLEGTTLNISLGGVYIVFKGVLLATENQPILIGLVSDVGVLELPAALRGLREVIDQRLEATAKPALGLAVEFKQLGTDESLILASLLDGLQERSVSVKLTVLWTPQDGGDLLLEVSSAGTSAVQRPTWLPSSPEDEDGGPQEYRLAVRVNLALPVHVEALDSSSTTRHYTAATVNLSTSGVCLRLRAQQDLLGRRLLLRLPPPSDMLANQPIGASAGSLDCTVTGEVVWIAPDTTVPEESRACDSASPLLVGFRLLHINEEAERVLEQMIARFLTSPFRIEEGKETTKLMSQLIERRNKRGQRIALYHDQPRDPLPPGSPVVIISPSHGETKKEYIALAYYLASNGFHAVRYDHTDHIGESDGSIVNTTLTTMQEDLHELLDYAQRTWPASPIMLIATGLTGRVALKAVSQDRRVTLLVLLNGVLDIKAALLSVHQKDLIAAHVRGDRLGMINLLGCTINADHWLENAIKGEYADLKTTMKDAELIHTPVILLISEKGEAARHGSVKELQTALRPDLLRVYMLPELSYRLHENPKRDQAIFRQVVTCCLEKFYPLSSKGFVLEPSQREIARQTRIEHERARIQHRMTKLEALEFWREYLEHLHGLANSPDYWQLLNHIYDLVGRLERGQYILDAGCGNGNFGMFLLLNQAYRRLHTRENEFSPPHYVGVDFIPHAIAQTRRNLMNATDQLRGHFPATITAQPPVRAALSLVDLNRPLPFLDNQFDRIICNLVLGYLQDPLFTLRELMRVLSPRGKLVMANLKPYADLALIARNLKGVARRPDDVKDAEQLLGNWGKILQGEREGLFRFFDKQKLAMLLTTSGAVQPRIYSTFANQAYIAVAEKPDSSG
ncbi:MAG TPA: PAS domain S-box protein [Nitrospiraceae bacterium]|nr:PAS domain S-box protein [Nitrospiraceae bacterium]